MWECVAPGKDLEFSLGAAIHVKLITWENTCASTSNCSWIIFGVIQSLFWEGGKLLDFVCIAKAPVHSDCTFYIFNQSTSWHLNVKSEHHEQNSQQLIESCHLTCQLGALAEVNTRTHLLIWIIPANTQLVLKESLVLRRGNNCRPWPNHLLAGYLHTIYRTVIQSELNYILF